MGLCNGFCSTCGSRWGRCPARKPSADGLEVCIGNCVGSASLRRAAGYSADLAGAAGDGGREGLGEHGEGLGFLAAQDETDGGVVDAEVGEVVVGQPGCGVPGQLAGVFGTGVEEDLAAGVGGHAFA